MRALVRVRHLRVFPFLLFSRPGCQVEFSPLGGTLESFNTDPFECQAFCVLSVLPPPPAKVWWLAVSLSPSFVEMMSSPIFFSSTWYSRPLHFLFFSQEGTVAFLLCFYLSLCCRPTPLLQESEIYQRLGNSVTFYFPGECSSFLSPLSRYSRA